MTVLEDFDVADGIYDASPSWQGMIRNPIATLVASAIPVKPPGAWFQNPNYSQLMPLTIQSDGRVSGHIASWRDDHIGMNGRVKPPHSKSQYAFFATGALETAEGTMVNVGQITLTGGHAPIEASVAEAVAHYDNTDSAIMDVAVGEDRHGIWVAGALRPTVDDNQLRAVRASSVSGDWRPINGSLEMVAVCAVNVPGFPIPRARVAGGQVLALVAAGTGALVDLVVHQDDGAADEIAASFDDRLRLVENVLLGKIGDTREALTAAIDEARGAIVVEDAPVDEGGELGADERVHSLRARVHPGAEADGVVADAEPDPLAALRARVHGGLTVADDDVAWEDGMPIDLDLSECLQASLRARVNGPLLARATASWTADERKKAANRGTALPGGRFPIKDKRDVEKAVHALGRAKGDKGKIKSHIVKRARSLGAMDKIPAGWK